MASTLLVVQTVGAALVHEVIRVTTTAKGAVAPTTATIPPPVPAIDPTTAPVLALLLQTPVMRVKIGVGISVGLIRPSLTLMPETGAESCFTTCGGGILL